MKILLRGLLALLFGLLLIVPSPAGGGGGGPGGVWILPSIRLVTGGMVGIFNLPLSEARVHRRFEDISGGITMRLPDEMRSPVGILYVPTLGVVVGGVAVENGLASISGARMKAFLRSGVERLELLFLGADGTCIPVLFVFDNRGEGTVDGYVF